MSVHLKELLRMAHEQLDSQAAMIEVLKGIIVNQSQESSWVSVDDRLPDELQEVTSYSAYDGMFQSIYRAGNFKKNLVVWEHLNVTHWMQLPPPPKAIKEDNQ
jgi:hypothetical protein